MRKIFFLTVIYSLFSLSLFGAFDKEGVLGVGGRATGMGDAFGAVADDGSAFYWNTAGLTQLDRSEVNLFLGPLLNGKEYYTLISYGAPFVQDTAWQLTAMSLIHNDPSSTKEFQIIGSFASALNLERTFSVGVNLKYLAYNSNASYTDPVTNVTLQGIANGIGLDVGLLYQIPMPAFGKKINIGLFIQDIDTVLHWQGGTEDERIPTLFKLAGAYYLDDNLLIAGDMDFFSDMNISGIPLTNPITNSQTGQTITALQPDETRGHIGVEGWFFKKHLGLRGGYTSFATMPGSFTGGVSYKENNWEIDYAYVGQAEYLGDSHRFSVILRFGPEKEKLRAISVVRPPTELKAYPANNAVNLTWDVNEDPNVTGYAVYMSKSPGSRYIPIAKRIRENYVTVDGLQDGTRYYFVVTSINNTYPSVESAYSNEASTVPAPVVPGTPEVFPIQQRKAVDRNGFIDVAWGKVPPANIAGYNIYITETSGKGYAKANASPIKDTHFTIKNLEVGKKYFYVLTGVTNDVPPIESKFSKESSDIAKPASALETQQTQQSQGKPQTK